MKNYLIKILCFAFAFTLFASTASAQKKRSATKRGTATRKNTKGKAKATTSTAQIDSLSTAAAAPATPANDSVPLTAVVKKSLRADEAVDSREIRDRIPLAYEHLRVDDAVYRHRIWREIDAREKINFPFRYAADEDNGNQRFISILLKAIQDDKVTVFDAIDDRFTTPLTKDLVAKMAGGGIDSVPKYDENGNISRYEAKVREVNFDSFYKFKIKEEVIFDKESSRLFWRILGIAPIKNVYSTIGDYIGTQTMFWIYYPDLRPVLATYQVYNGKNFGARMSWEELFEQRMFSGRIIKSTIDNPFDLPFEAAPGLKDNTIFQLLEGERVKEKVFNYELDLWSY